MTLIDPAIISAIPDSMNLIRPVSLPSTEERRKAGREWSRNINLR
ncbi:hypothetical protein [Novosphingobium sp. CF614]|nr:hypothetical protein [Novosphingobium sp. CF614]